MENLSRIQRELKAPKSQYNSFGKYNYRSCEDILEAVKPLLRGAVITISDKVVEVGSRVYVQATATFYDGVFKHSVSAYAREPEDRKGMDDSQITGATSSYARKYALNGLLLIDDNKDADTDEHKKQTAPEKPTTAPQATKPETVKATTADILKAVKAKLGKKMEGMSDEEKVAFYKFCIGGKKETVDVVQDIIDRYDDYYKPYLALPASINLRPTGNDGGDQ